MDPRFRTEYSEREPENSGLSQIMPDMAENGCLRLGEDTDAEALAAVKDAVKRGQCRRLLIANIGALGSDEWLRAENESFFVRNGAELIFADKPVRDRRTRIANAILRYFNPCGTWAVTYGDELPPQELSAGNRRLPYGYCAKDGRICPDGKRAEIVRRLFIRYAEGESRNALAEEFSSIDGRLSLSSVCNILANRVYLGMPTEGGYRLPGVISYREWFAAERMRISRSEEPVFVREPYLPVCGAGGRALAFFRGKRPEVREGVILVDSSKLEEDVESVVSKLAADGAEIFCERYLPMRLKRIEAAVPPAERELETKRTLFDDAVERLVEGERSDEAQSLAERLRRECESASFRLRRLLTEKEMFSAKREWAEEFFAKAADIRRLSRGEKRFIASAFVAGIVADNEGADVYCASPRTGKLVKKRIRI